MKNIDHLYERSNKLLKRVGLRRMLNPGKALRDEIFAHSSLVMFYASKGDETYRVHLNKLLDLELIQIKKSPRRLSPEIQNDLILMAMATNRVEDAVKVCSIEVEYSQSHKFSILLNCKLRRLLRVPVLTKEPNYKILTSESGLFKAIDNILDQIPVDFVLLEKYWKLTKSKRYEYTVFEYLDVFSLALRTAEIALTDSSS